MILQLRQDHADPFRIPRESGDDPLAAVILPTIKAYSPRERG